VTAVSTCLWLGERGEEAVKLYVSLVPGSAITAVHRPAAGAPAVLIHFRIGDAPFSALCAPGGPPPGHAASIVVQTEDQAGTDALWAAHLDAGSTPVACGWITDRFGVSWQVFPKTTGALLFGGTPEANARAFAAMQAQVKIDTAAIAAAARGA
jgi:predicted 3-demethylubiquinone-9 3-methyltransferase (glyoxalase superfamily)